MKKLSILVLGLFLVLQLNTSIAEAEGYSSNKYIVKSGDSLPVIAKRFNTTVDNLKAINGLQSNIIISGQALWIPVTHEVVSGDTLKKISTTYNTSIQTIKITNRLSSDLVYTGQKLRINPKRMTMQGQYIIMTREEFKGWLLNNRFRRKILIIQHHHTWAPSYKHFNGSNHFQLLKGMERYHMKKKGWKTIAQNITTFPDGKIAISRSFNMDPEGSIGQRANAGAIMIENIGNFDKGHDVMTAEQKNTIVEITALLSIKFGLTPSIDSITYHHWWDMKTGKRVLDNGYAVKSCPGTAFFGGNSTKSAKNHFYPLVSRRIKETLQGMR